MEENQPKFSSDMRKFIATSRGRSYSVIVITGLLILVLVFFAILPAVSSILLQLSQNDSRLAALTKIDQKRETLRTLLGVHDQNLATAVGLNHALPFSLEQDDVIKDIVGFAGTNGVFLRSVRFVDIAGRSRLSELYFDEPDFDFIDGVIINISLEGDRQNLRQFIASLEQSRRVFSLKTISISKVSAAESATNSPFIMNLQMESYYWNQNKEEGGV